jgi:hypothetical protein
METHIKVISTSTKLMDMENTSGKTTKTNTLENLAWE